MITYGGVRIQYKPDSLVILYTEVVQSWHHIGTNLNTNTGLGRESTQISIVAVTQTPTEKLVLDQLIHEFQARNLVVYDRLYKQVTVVDQKRAVPVTPDGSVWEYSLTFKAADPHSYDAATGEVVA